MKRIKKLAALMMAAIMALAMSMTAFATDSGSDSNATKAKHVYEIYQIFIGDYAKVDGKDLLSNIKCGGNSIHRK